MIIFIYSCNVKNYLTVFLTQSLSKYIHFKTTELKNTVVG